MSQLQRMKIFAKVQADRIDQLSKRNDALIADNIHLRLVIAAMTKELEARQRVSSVMPLDAVTH